MADKDYVVVDQYWCLTEDRKRVVSETDPRARWLHWRPGDRVKRDEAKRLGALKRRSAPADKAKAKPGDKATGKPADKSGGDGGGENSKPDAAGDGGQSKSEE